MPHSGDVDPHEGWSDRARQVADVAGRHARAGGDGHVRPEHYLIALLDIGRGAGNRPNVALLVLESLSVPVDDLRQRIDDGLGDGGRPHQDGVSTTPELRRVLKAARLECDLMGHQHVGTEHLLVGIAVEGTSRATQVLHEFGATPDRLRERVYSVLTMHAHGLAPGPDGTTHHVTLPAEIRDLDETIARLRHRKEQAIDAGDYQAAVTFRNEEKQALVRHAAAVRAWAPQVDVVRLVREVGYLRGEVQRLTRILAQRGIETDEEQET